jgi:DNA-binding MarR family transcriptional regulator
MSGKEGLTALELLILRSIPRAADVEELSTLVKVRPASLGMEIAKLQLRGYISDDGALTQKGKEAVAGP